MNRIKTNDKIVIIIINYILRIIPVEIKEIQMQIHIHVQTQIKAQIISKRQQILHILMKAERNQNQLVII